MTGAGFATLTSTARAQTPLASEEPLAHVGDIVVIGDKNLGRYVNVGFRLRR